MDQISKTDVDIFMRSLRKANPALANVINYVHKNNSNENRVKTFEECKQIEQEIIAKLTNTSPLE